MPMLDKLVKDESAKDPTCVLLAGGGTESYVTARHLVTQKGQVPLFLHFVMDGALKEAVLAQAKSLGCPVLFIEAESHMLHRRPEGYIPGYRQEMILRACQTAEVYKLTDMYIGDLEDDHPTGPLEGVFKKEILGGDERAFEEFKHTAKLRMVQLYNDVYRKDHAPLTLHAPFGLCSKAQVLAEGQSMGCDWGMTMTCRRSAMPHENVILDSLLGPQLHSLPVHRDKQPHEQYVPCGQCYFCRSRADAFSEAGIVDPVAERIRKENP